MVSSRRGQEGIREAGLLLCGLALLLPSCSSVKKFMAIESVRKDDRPIDNPFGTLYAPSGSSAPAPLVVRSRRGEQSVEFEIPSDGGSASDFEVPVDVSQWSSSSSGRAPASVTSGTSAGDAYAARPPSVADREIQATIPVAPLEESVQRREIEEQMGLQEAGGGVVAPARSYLGRLDRVRTLYREARYEASLLEVEDMLREFPMDSKLHEMRGTLLDRLGHAELAKQSWQQALEIQPSNESLRKFLSMKGGTR